MALSRPEEVILEAVERFGEDRLALAASWQKETAVLVDLVRRHAPAARIFTLDTGVLFEETYATWRAVEDADCWLSGVRRDQSPDRAHTEELDWDDRHGLWKANPLATWSESDVWAYIARHDLPYNPLHDQGYSSIGCTHCTLPGDGREGRWAGLTKTECGMHAPVAGRAAA